MLGVMSYADRAKHVRSSLFATTTPEARIQGQFKTAEKMLDLPNLFLPLLCAHITQKYGYEVDIREWAEAACGI